MFVFALYHIVCSELFEFNLCYKYSTYLYLTLHTNSKYKMVSLTFSHDSTHCYYLSSVQFFDI